LVRIHHRPLWRPGRQNDTGIYVGSLTAPLSLHTLRSVFIGSNGGLADARNPRIRRLMATLPQDTKLQWQAWTQSNVAKPFRKQALKAALKTLASGSSADQAIAAAKEAERKRANYMATSALVLGIISAAVALFVGGLSILATLFAIASAVQGRLSVDRAWQAWSGLALAIVGVGIFAVELAIR
jgi:hypothetical protein